MNRVLKRVAVTTGDPDGIGLEVSVKALLKLGPQKDVLFFLFRDSQAPSRQIKKLDPLFQRKNFSALSEALRFLSGSRPSSRKWLMDIASPVSAPFWVQEAAENCMKKALDGLVTAPMSKELIIHSGLSDIGHTEILSRVANGGPVYMGFTGPKFSVVLATGHCPLSEVRHKLTFEVLKGAVLQAHKLSLRLKKKNPLGLLGLNPHSGEKGIIGNEEGTVIRDVLAWAAQHHIKVEGPLVPDAAFFPNNWKKYSCYVACYHDQGLIPFKMIHGQDTGCHISLGLPFVRTSVDHGTAKDIFGKNKANPNSMSEAIELCNSMLGR